jgi:hypothetical protein
MRGPRLVVGHLGGGGERCRRWSLAKGACKSVEQMCGEKVWSLKEVVGHSDCACKRCTDMGGMEWGRE